MDSGHKLVAPQNAAPTDQAHPSATTVPLPPFLVLLYTCSLDQIPKLHLIHNPGFWIPSQSLPFHSVHLHSLSSTPLFFAHEKKWLLHFIGPRVNRLQWHLPGGLLNRGRPPGAPPGNGGFLLWFCSSCMMFAHIELLLAYFLTSNGPNKQTVFPLPLTPHETCHF